MQRTAPLVAGILLLVLFLSPIRWLAQSLQATEYRLHSILLIVFAAFLLSKKSPKNFAFEKFELRLAPTLTLVGGILGFITTQKILNTDIISCVFLGVTIYGFSGFIVDSKKWRRSLVTVLLFFACLPLSYHIETFLGFPLRMMSAKLAGTFFSITGNPIQTTETILLIENKFSHIDLPCSGIKGLWSITLFCLVLSSIENFKINVSWFLAILSGWALVAAANVFRIIALVKINNSNLPEIMKSSLHVPVGLIGFLVACLATYWIVVSICQPDNFPIEAGGKKFEPSSFAIVCLFLLASVLTNEIYFPVARKTRSQRGDPNSNAGIALTDKEKDLFLRFGVIQYEKKRFNANGLSGTAFLVLAKSWRAHHHPEQCLQGQGAIIDSTRTLVIQEGLHVRSVELKESSSELIYWFQSLEDSTDDYSSRVWSGLIHPFKPYVMVSLYLDNGMRADPPAFKTLIVDFHRQAKAMLENKETNEIQY